MRYDGKAPARDERVAMHFLHLRFTLFRDVEDLRGKTRSSREGLTDGIHVLRRKMLQWISTAPREYLCQKLREGVVFALPVLGISEKCPRSREWAKGHG